MNTVRVKGRQGGAALIISLVLIVMALGLSVSSMQSSRIEETMAGNQRAAERALRAAEYGGAVVTERIQNKLFSQATNSVFASELCAEVDCNVGHEIEPGLYYEIAVDTGPSYAGYTRKVTARGKVYSGDSGGELIAMRELDFFMRLEGVGKLAAFNPACLSSFHATSNAADASGDVIEVDGQYEPAISTASLVEANEVVEGVLISNKDGEITTTDGTETGYVVHKDVVFVEKSSEVGVYHATEYVTDKAGAAIGGSVNVVDEDSVIVDYSRKCVSHAMCNYKGGVSSYAASPIMSNPAAFHNFISTLFRDGKATFTTFEAHQDLVFDPNGYGFNIVTNNHYSVLNATVADSDGNDRDVPLAFSHGDDFIKVDTNADGADDEIALLMKGGMVDEGFYDLSNYAHDIAYSAASSASSTLMIDAASLSDSDLIGARDNYRLASYSGPVGEIGAANSQPSGSSVSYSASYLPTTQQFYDLSALGSVYEEGVSDACYSFGMAVGDTVATYASTDAVMNDGFDYYDETVPGEYFDVDAFSGVKRYCLGCNDEDVLRGDVKAVSWTPTPSYAGKKGILVIDGHVVFKGNPSFEGLIIVLGDYSISGGGGDDFRGAVMSYPYFYNHRTAEFQCQKSTADNNGTGNHDTLHDQDAIDAALGLMSEESWDAWITANDSEKYSYYLTGWNERLVN